MLLTLLPDTTAWVGQGRTSLDAPEKPLDARKSLWTSGIVFTGPPSLFWQVLPILAKIRVSVVLLIEGDRGQGTMPI